jgi:ribosomal protein S18 acetylase RimI-like enzyme
LTDGFVIEPLGAHDRASFSCGATALDEYLRKRASQDVKRLMASCFVAIDSATDKVAGYYTLAASTILADDLPLEISKRLPRYPALPTALIGRLAVDHSYHRRGLGGALIADAALRVIQSGVKAFAMIVEAKDENAVAFYRRLGFVQFFSRPRSFFLPLETTRKAIGGAGM